MVTMPRCRGGGSDVYVCVGGVFLLGGGGGGGGVSRDAF